jgi:hypothetical protein
MTRKPAGLAVPLILVGFLPVALFGLLGSVNEYRDQGIAGAVDCNGRLTVMLFIAPCLVVYAGGAVHYAALLKGGRRGLPTVALMVLCLAIASAAGGKAWTAYGEKSRPEHRESCGDGW